MASSAYRGHDFRMLVSLCTSEMRDVVVVAGRGVHRLVLERMALICRPHADAYDGVDGSDLATSDNLPLEGYSCEEILYLFSIRFR